MIGLWTRQMQIKQKKGYHRWVVADSSDLSKRRRVRTKLTKQGSVLYLYLGSCFLMWIRADGCSLLNSVYSVCWRKIFWIPRFALMAWETLSLWRRPTSEHTSLHFWEISLGFRACWLVGLELIFYVQMSKTKNTSAHNNAHKAHRNGIHKRKIHAKKSLKGVCFILLALFYFSSIDLHRLSPSSWETVSTRSKETRL